MMRRLRFELFANLMRFKPEDIRTVKPAEAASMIKDEVEPIGGFIGDAFIQPAFLSTQALTALIFIMTQSFWLGMVALSIVLIQAFVIPYLRREQLRLGRLRQLASRALAGRIGEMIDGSRTIQTYGLKDYSESEIGDRLGHLYGIRAALYKRKFAVKYLNNILAQITPFFFYSIGGYLALRGSLDIGQLVAVIAAYRDLPPPIKELIDWDQRRADVTIKYEQIISQFSGRDLIPPDQPDDQAEPIAPDTPILISDLTVADQRGSPLISGATLTINRPSKVAVVGSSGSGRDILARVIGRQTTKYEGRVALGARDLKSLSLSEIACEISYAPPEAELFSGSIRNNVTLSIKNATPQPEDLGDLRWREAQRTGNPMHDHSSDWSNYEAAGVANAEELEREVVQALTATGLGEELYAFGLNGRLSADADDELKERIVMARHDIRGRMRAAKLDRIIEPFDFAKFNPQSTIGENLVFGVVAGDRLTSAERTSDRYFRAIVAAESLREPLTEIGLRIAENSVEVFSELPAGHPLFERFSMIRASDLEDFAELVEQSQSLDGTADLSEASCDKLIALALDYVEPRHRLGLVTDELAERILRARQSFRAYLPQDYAGEIEFYDPDRVMSAAPIRDNLLFGRVAQNVANAETRISNFLKEVLPELGMEDLIYSLGLDFDVGPKGQALFTPQRASVSLARSIICHPRILILEDVLKSFTEDDAKRVLANVAKWNDGATLIVTAGDIPPGCRFDNCIRFEGAKLSVQQMTGDRPAGGRPDGDQEQSSVAHGSSQQSLSQETDASVPQSEPSQ